MMATLVLAQLCRGADPLDTWTRLVSGASANLNAVVFGKGTFVAVGDNGVVTTSTNGTDWTVRTVGTTLYGVAFGTNGRFVAVGDNGATLASSDGVDWTPGASGTTNAFRGITYGGNQFVAVGADGAISTSADGSQWTGRNFGTNNRFLSVAEDTNGVAVAVGYSVSNGVSESIIFTSPDNTNWAQTYGGTADRVLFGVARGASNFVAVESYVGRTSSVSYGIILTSTDGTNWWQTYSTANPVILNGLTYGNGLFVCVAWQTIGQGVILSSPDGSLWTSHSTGSAAWLDADTYGNGRFVVVGQGGTILKSQSVVRLSPLTFLQNGPAQFAVTGASGWTYPIEASSNLTAWVTLTNLALTNDTGQFTDWSATSFSQRFYRAVAQ